MKSDESDSVCGSGCASTSTLSLPLVAQDSTNAASRHKLVLTTTCWLALSVIPLYLVFSAKQKSVRKLEEICYTKMCKIFRLIGLFEIYLFNIKNADFNFRKI